MIQVLERFNRILEYVAEKNGVPARVKELSPLLNVSQSACSNIVGTMVKLAYLESSPDGSGYILGPKPSLLVTNGTYKQHLVKIASPFIKTLVSEINEMCLLVTNSHFKRIEVIRKQGERPVQVSSGTQAGENLFQTATGMIILAHLPGTDVKKYCEKNPVFKTVFPDISNYESLAPKLKKLREKSYLLIIHDSKEHDAFGSLAVPVYNNNRLEAVLGCKFPSYRCKGERRISLIRECVKTASQISEALSKISM